MQADIVCGYIGRSQCSKNSNMTCLLFVRVLKQFMYTRPWPPRLQPTMKLLMTAKKDKGRYIIAMNPEYLKRGEPSTLGKVKAVAQRRQYIVYDNGFKANKTL